MCVVPFLDLITNFPFLQIDCLVFQFDSSPLFLLCIVACFGSVWLLLEQCEVGQASKITKLFVWPMAVLLCLHWLFDITAQTIARTHPQIGLNESMSFNFLCY